MATFGGNRVVDPRKLYGDLVKATDQTTMVGGGYGGQAGAAAGVGSGNTTPAQTDPFAGGTNPHHAPSGDFWTDFLAAIKPFAGTNYDTIAGNQSKLAPLMQAALGAFGGEANILKYLGYNPRKGINTALSYLTGNPYYDKGNNEDGSEYWTPFYVPGFDYDPATPGIQAPPWAKGRVGENPGGLVT